MTTPAEPRVSKVVSDFELRAARAELLLRLTPAAREPLQFAAGLYRVQARIASEIESANREEPLTGHLSEDVDRFRDRVSYLLR
ncbi:MAG TPA: hypothetical protein VJA66_15285, partial [Thermoanaerobaculia bacterium]